MTPREFDYRLGRLRRFLHRSSEAPFPEQLHLQAAYAVSDEPIPWPLRRAQPLHAISEGQCWGEPWQNGWFRLRAKLPSSWLKCQDKGTFALRIDLGGEALLYDGNGVPCWSFANQSIFNPEYTKDLYILPPELIQGEWLEFWVEATASSLHGMEMDREPHVQRHETPTGTHRHPVQFMRIVRFDESAWRLRIEFNVLLSLLEALPEQDYRRMQLLEVLSSAVDAYSDDPANSDDARRKLLRWLSLAALDSSLPVTAVGHAHIDVAYLWRSKEAPRKAVRTFASQLQLIDKYPEYVFGASQPLLYRMVEETSPELFQRLRKQVSAGRWELQGGMWVECDCNIPCGESLIRQFLHGKNYWQSRFGVDVETVWLPDLFGAPATLPQIIRGCGCRYFVSQKLSWNTINPFPHHSFIWEGLDGSQVLAHFPPENTYNSTGLAGEYYTAQNNYQQGNLGCGFLSLVGIGDGGGGPKEEHLERVKLAANLHGAPRVSFGAAGKFMAELEESFKGALPRWKGGLYLEKHRGTFTTQAQCKRLNRKLEQQLLALEKLACTLPPEKYPRRELKRLWRTLLNNQFHDIIAGSAIHQAYADQQLEFRRLEKHLSALFDKVASEKLTPVQRQVTFCNTLHCEYHRVLQLPAAWSGGTVTDESGKGIPTQVDMDGKVTCNATIPAGGSISLRYTPGKSSAAAAVALRDEKLLLENKYLRCTFAKNGRMLSLQRLPEGEEVLASPGNIFALYGDWPVNYDAWEVEQYTRQEQVDTARAIGEPVREVGAVQSSLRFRLAIGESVITQQVILGAEAPMVEFHTSVQWREARKTLRVSFPTIYKSDWGNCEVPFGFEAQPAQRNTSWESARFEVCHHRYCDLSSNDAGVSLLNDCKYGCRLEDGVMDLNLLRSPKFPDYHADLGDHQFTYALMPHRGGWPALSVMDMAAQLNRPPQCFDNMGGKITLPVAVIGEGVELSALKRAEDGDDLIVRLVEQRGVECTCRVVRTSDMAPVTLVPCQHIEWNSRPLLAKAGTLTLAPFQIATFRVEL